MPSNEIPQGGAGGAWTGRRAFSPFSFGRASVPSKRHKGHGTVPCCHRQNEVTHTRYQTWSNQGFRFTSLTHSSRPSIPAPTHTHPRPAYRWPNPPPPQRNGQRVPNRGLGPFATNWPSDFIFVLLRIVRCSFDNLISCRKAGPAAYSIYRGMDATALLGKEERRF